MSRIKEKPCLPFGWEVHQSKTFPQYVYYYNTVTNVSSWKCPQLISPADSSQSTSRFPLPPLLADPSIVLQDKKTRMQATVKTTARVIKPSDASHQTSTKAMSPPCVSSSSEVADLQLSSQTKAKSPETTGQSPLLRRKLKRPILSIPETSSEVSRYKPHSMKNQDQKKRIISLKSSSDCIKPSLENQCVLVKSRSNSVSNSVPEKNKNNNLIIKSSRSPVSFSPQSRLLSRIRKNQALASPKKSTCIAKSQTLIKLARSQTSTCAAKPQTSTYIARTKVSTCVTRPSTSTSISQSQASYSITKPQTSSCIAKTHESSFSTAKQITKMSQVAAPVSVLQIRTTADKGNSSSSGIQEDHSDYSSDVEMLDLSNDCTEPSLSKGYFIVVDTNILMSNLKLIDELKDSPLDGCGPPAVVVPWVVLQELDGIKSDKDKEAKKVFKANEAVRYIYGMFAAKHPRFMGQSSFENPRDLEGSLDPSCNDDMILNCCLQMIRKWSREKVVLLTNDKNLCNKAMVHQIQAYTSENLLQHLKVDFADITSSPAYAMTCSMSRPTELSEGEESLRTEVDRIMMLAKSLLKSCLGEFLQSEMYAAYKGDMWLTVVQLKPPWSLLDILECLNKHWVAVFTFVLDREMRNHIENLHKILRTTKGYVFDEEQAYNFVSSGISLCTNVASRNSTTAKECLVKLHQLSQKLLCLGKNNKHADSSSDNINKSLRQETSTNLNRNLSSYEQRSSQESNIRLKQMFQHVWAILNHLCGTVLDSFGWPHKLNYQRPPTLPSKEETDKFIPILYPELQKLRKYMMSVVSAEDINDEKCTNNISGFYKQLTEVLPALNVNESPPVSISEEELKSFCTNSDNKEILQGGLKQLNQLFTLVHKSIVGTAKLQ